MFQCVLWHVVVFQCVLLCFVASCCVLLRFIAFYHILSHFFAFHRISSHFIAFDSIINQGTLTHMNHLVLVKAHITIFITTVLLLFVQDIPAGGCDRWFDLYEDRKQRNRCTGQIRLGLQLSIKQVSEGMRCITMSLRRHVRCNTLLFFSFFYCFLYSFCSDKVKNNLFSCYCSNVYLCSLYLNLESMC